MFKNIFNTLVITASILICTQAHAAEHQFPQTPPTQLANAPRIRSALYLMEYHIWFKSPFGEQAPDGYTHWDVRLDHVDQTVGPDWMRDKAEVGYPMLGIYNAEDRNVIHWQLQCMKNAGINGTFVQMFPDWIKGQTFDRTFVWDKILEIAGEIGYKIGCHDEVQFRQNRPAQKWDVMGNRLGNFIKQYGSHPAFLKINNQPAMAFQFWNRFGKTMSNEELAKMIKLAEQVAGMEIYWILHVAPNEKLFAMKQIDAFIPMANTNALMHRVSGFTHTPKMDWPRMEGQLIHIDKFKKKFPSTDIGLWMYGGFDASPRVVGDGRKQIRWIKRNVGKTLMKTVRQYNKHKPDFMMLTSWNDWEENTAIEPGWQAESQNGDPYFYCKLIAKMQGTTFTPPALPAKESIDPLMWQTLYGIDKTPPTIAHIRYKPMAPAIVVTAMDTGSAIKSVKALEHGDFYVDATHYNKPIFKNITSMTPGNTIEGGYKLSTQAPITLVLNTKKIQQAKTHQFYIAIEYADTSHGSITVNYPNAHRLINYKPGDENRFEVRSSVSLKNSGEQQVAVCPMLGFLKNQNTVKLTFKLIASRKHPNPQPILVSRIHVFADMADTQTGMRLDAGKIDSQVQTYKIGIDPLKTLPTQKAVYVVAEDAAGNLSMPVPFHGNQAHALVNHR